MSKKERRQPVRASAIIAPVDQDFVSRRIARHLNDLERSNYTEATSGPSRFGDNDEDDKNPTALGSKSGEDDGQGKKKKKQTPGVRQLLMYRKTLAMLIEESNLLSQPKTTHSYVTAASSPSSYPPLILCSVCGFNGNYSCRRCGLKYCDIGCQQIHDETRCERR